jgi:PAS domain-containing protein
MAAPVEVGTPDEQQVRRHLRDLLAFSTLPAIWGDRDQGAGAAGAARDRGYANRQAKRSRCLGFDPRCRTATAAVTAEIAHPLAEDTVRISCAPIGSGGEAVLVAGASRSDFPTEAQHLTLRIAASQIAIAIDRWRAAADQHRFAALVQRSSDFIGFASLSGMRQYLNPAGIELVGLESAAAAIRLHVLDFVPPRSGSASATTSGR